MPRKLSALMVLGFAAVLGAAGCTAEPTTPPRIVTSDVPQLSGMEALLRRGTLVADENGCVQVETAGRPVTLVWPKGYTVRGDSESFEILDGNKKVVVRSGSPFSIGGGGVGAVSEEWAEGDCAKDVIWMAGALAESSG